MKILRTTSRSARAVIAALESRRAASDPAITKAVARIVAGVKSGGDSALLRYAAKFDGYTSQSPLQISPDEMRAAWEATPRPLQAALKTAAKNIRAFAQRQLPRSWSFSPVKGLTTGQQVRALDSVGCYVPSGRYPLPSTMLMTVIPAQVAGVRRIVVVSPRPAQETLAAASLLGVTEFYRIGGAQAIAALAYGTASVPRVAKIVGPGNAYVTAAKEAVAFDCGIDMLAGPTEIVVTSESGKAVNIASDLIAQAEHDPDALAIFITSNAALAEEVSAEIKLRVRANPIAAQSIRAHGLIIVTRSVTESRELTNRLAAEHLTVDSESDLAWVQNAGSVFIGRWSPQPMGDYISGPNHTLPTGGLARVRGGLSVLDFVKLITVQQYTAAGLQSLGPAAIALAEAEGLHGHAEAIRARGVR